MIRIKPSATADTRTANGPVSKDELYKSSAQHIVDVQMAMAFFAEKLRQAGIAHDNTKIGEIDQFHKDFCMWQKEGFDKASKWYDMHIKTERHHLNEHCPEDVTLIDVLERIADICMAGMGRSGKVTPDELDAEILRKAYANTIKLLTEQIEVEK